MNKTGRLAAPARGGRAGLLTLVLSVAAIFATAIACAFILQRSTHLDWHNRPATDVVIHSIDVALVTVVITLVWAVIGRLSWSLALVAGVSTLLAGINHSKVQLRREPIFPGDRSFVSEPSFALSMVDTRTVLTIVLTVLVTMGGVAVIGAVLGRRLPRPRLRHVNGALNLRLLGVRLVTLLLSAGLLVHATHFNEPRNLWRALYDVNANWMPWSQLHNYRSNGFIGGFLYNMPVTAMEQPENYDQEAMTELAARYEQRAAELNVHRTGSLEDTNVVFILAETVTDPSWLDGFTLDENPVPYTQQVMDETIAGRMYSHSYGGGTATMEFEALTGQAVGLFRAQVTSPYQQFVGDEASYPSVVGTFAELGHRTIAIHSYNLHMYKRPQVYQAFGFDEVIDDAAMQSQHRIATSRYISDAAAFDEVLYQLDQHQGPSFVNLVTMQNHGAHHGSYPNPIGVEGLTDPNKAEEYGQYARGLAHTDEALEDFLGALQERDEHTIVVYYGDHHPGVYDEEMINHNPGDALFQTPFFVWSSDTNQAQEVPAIAPSMFLPLVYEAAHAPMPAYVALLDDVRRIVPVIQHARMLDPQGQPVDAADLDAEAAALLEDLRMTQYDFSVGGRYAIDRMWPGAEQRPATN